MARATPRSALRAMALHTMALSCAALSPLVPRSPPQTVWLKQTAAVAASSAVLGPLCDGCHSRHDVLHYANPTVQLPLLETCWWVPVLFSLAGITLGTSHPILDRLAESKLNAPRRPAPGWTATLLCIGSFCACYELSGVLAQAADAAGKVGLGARATAVDVPLAVNALAIFLIFERSWGGLFMALLTAVAGPVVEIGLIQVFGLYHYSSPDVLGIPLWIAWVYAAGGPAVGNLGRQVLWELELEEEAEQRRLSRK